MFGKGKLTTSLLLHGATIIGAAVATCVAWFSAEQANIEPTVTGGNKYEYFESGSGSESDPYIITKPEHYFHLTHLWEDSWSGFLSETYITFGKAQGEGANPTFHNNDSDGKPVSGSENMYTCSLNMGYYDGSTPDRTILPLGSGEQPFTGHINGNNLTVKNLKVNGNGRSDIGIFGYVGSGATISNIYFDYVTIECSTPDLNDDAPGLHNHPHPTHANIGYLAGHTDDANCWQNVYVNHCKTVNSQPASKDKENRYGYFGYVGSYNHQGNDLSYHSTLKAKDVYDYFDSTEESVGVKKYETLKNKGFVSRNTEYVNADDQGKFSDAVTQSGDTTPTYTFNEQTDPARKYSLATAGYRKMSVTYDLSLSNATSQPLPNNTEVTATSPDDMATEAQGNTSAFNFDRRFLYWDEENQKWVFYQIQNPEGHEMTTNFQCYFITYKPFNSTNSYYVGVGEDKTTLITNHPAPAEPMDANSEEGKRFLWVLRDSKTSIGATSLKDAGGTNADGSYSFRWFNPYSDRYLSIDANDNLLLTDNTATNNNNYDLATEIKIDTPKEGQAFYNNNAKTFTTSGSGDTLKLVGENYNANNHNWVSFTFLGGSNTEQEDDAAKQYKIVINIDELTPTATDAEGNALLDENNNPIKNVYVFGYINFTNKNISGSGTANKIQSIYMGQYNPDYTQSRAALNIPEGKLINGTDADNATLRYCTGISELYIETETVDIPAQGNEPATTATYYSFKDAAFTAENKYLSISSKSDNVLGLKTVDDNNPLTDMEKFIVSLGENCGDTIGWDDSTPNGTPPFHSHQFVMRVVHDFGLNTTQKYRQIAYNTRDQGNGLRISGYHCNSGKDGQTEYLQIFKQDLSAPSTLSVHTAFESTFTVGSTEDNCTAITQNTFRILQGHNSANEYEPFDIKPDTANENPQFTWDYTTNYVTSTPTGYPLGTYIPSYGTTLPNDFNSAVTITYPDDQSDGGWNLVTDSSTLKAGDKIIFAYVKNTNAATAGALSGGYLTSITPAANTFNEDKSQILNPGASLQFTLGGSSADGWTFENNGGLLAANGDKKVNLSGTGTSTWKITAIDADGNATIESTNASSYGNFQYNPSSPRFTNYKSKTQQPIRIYRFTQEQQYDGSPVYIGDHITDTAPEGDKYDPRYVDVVGGTTYQKESETNYSFSLNNNYSNIYSMAHYHATDLQNTDNEIPFFNTEYVNNAIVVKIKNTDLLDLGQLTIKYAGDAGAPMLTKGKDTGDPSGLSVSGDTGWRCPDLDAGDGVTYEMSFSRSNILKACYCTLDGSGDVYSYHDTSGESLNCQSGNDSFSIDNVGSFIIVIANNSANPMKVSEVSLDFRNIPGNTGDFGSVGFRSASYNDDHSYNDTLSGRVTSTILNIYYTIDRTQQQQVSCEIYFEIDHTTSEKTYYVIFKSTVDCEINVFNYDTTTYNLKVNGTAYTSGRNVINITASNVSTWT